MRSNYTFMEFQNVLHIVWEWKGTWKPTEVNEESSSLISTRFVSNFKCRAVGVDVAWELAWLGRLSKTVSITEQAAGKDS